MRDAAGPAGPKVERSFLTFRSHAQNYALPAEEVAEIITLPQVARLPQSPASLLGMANLRGAVIAVASLRGLLQQPPGEPGGAGERAILLNGPAPVAISVDHVDALISLDEAQVDRGQTELAATPGERLRGAFQQSPDAQIVKILDIQTLLAAAFTQVARSPRKSVKTSGLARPEREAAAVRMLISFELAGQEFALPLQDVQEITPLPASKAVVPRGAALLLGIVSHRDKMLPLLSLRGLLGFPLGETEPETAKVIVTLVAGVPVGLVVDRAKAVISAAADRVQPAPAMLAARMGSEARIGAIYRDSAGRIISILAVERMFGEEVMARLSRLSEQNAVPEATPQRHAPIRQFLVFRLGGEEFGLPISAVDEVALAPEKITSLPKTPKFLKGVINLRGEVLPVIDQRRRFDLPEDESLRRRLLVMRSQRHRAGLLVDSISGVVSASEDEIAPAPQLAGEQASMVEAVLNLEAARRMVLLLNPDEVLTRTERGLLDDFTTRQKTRG